MTIDSYRAGDPAGTELMMRYDANKKSVLLAYLIWFFLGLFGVHRFYLGRVVSGLCMLALHGISWILAFILIGYLGFALLGLWWLIDALLIPRITRDANERRIERLRQGR